jgi:Kef-type K+ transport system membrane component KefB
VSPGEVVGISLLAVGFLAGAIIVGQLIAARLSRFFARIDSGPGTKLSVAVAFCLTFAYLANLIGLAPIVGAFAAGLILDEVHFKWFDGPRIKMEVLQAVRGGDAGIQHRVKAVLDRYADKHLEHMIEPLGHFTVPLFFVLAGMQVHLEAFFDPTLLAVALALSVAAIIGKLVCGLVAGRGVNRWLVGWGMVPRGEVGLIFAFVGKSLGVISDGAFSAIVVMVMLTTLVTPPVLAYLLRSRQQSVDHGAPTGIADQKT